jgi:branched-chain amino acid transport system substrate-binding protein
MPFAVIRRKYRPSARRPEIKKRKLNEEKPMSTARINRRGFLKTTAATGLALAGGSMLAPAAHAATTIKVGYVSPQTGPLAAFGESDEYILGMVRELLKDGIKSGETTYAVEIIVKDSQSNPNRAAEVAKELIVNDEINLMLVASTPETVNPVSTQCEIEGVPCISTKAPWQPYFIGRQANPADPGSWKPFEWTYHYFWGLEDITAVLINMWNQLETNKQVGGLFPNDADGNALGDPNVGYPSVLGPAGYTITDPGRYQNLSDDFSAQIAAFQAAKTDIITGVVLPPDFTTFWNQAIQKGFKPKICSVAKAMLFPVAAEALGKNANNISMEVWWSPSHPFKSSLNGMSAKELADGYTKATGKQWTQPIGYIHSLFEFMVDAIRRASDPTDAKALATSIASADFNTIIGPIKFGQENVPPFARANVSRTPLVGGQWRLQGDGKYEVVIVDNKTAPNIPTGGKMEPIV